MVYYSSVGCQKFMGNVDLVAGATVAIAVATVVNVGVAWFQWKAASKSAIVAQQVFEAANRPYVGLEGFKITEPALNSLNIEATIKNFGTASAEAFDCSWDVYIGGILQPAIDLGSPSNTMLLFPGLRSHLKGDLRGTAYTQVIQQHKPLEIIVRVSYNWQPGKTCTYNEKHRYDPTNNAFISLGEVC